MELFWSEIYLTLIIEIANSKFYEKQHLNFLSHLTPKERGYKVNNSNCSARPVTLGTVKHHLWSLKSLFYQIKAVQENK